MRQNPQRAQDNLSEGNIRNSPRNHYEPKTQKTYLLHCLKNLIYTVYNRNFFIEYHDTVKNFVFWLNNNLLI